jgi:hypothetical protein
MLPRKVGRSIRGSRAENEGAKREPWTIRLSYTLSDNSPFPMYVSLWRTSNRNEHFPGRRDKLISPEHKEGIVPEIIAGISDKTQWIRRFLPRKLALCTFGHIGQLLFSFSCFPF